MAKCRLYAWGANSHGQLCLGYQSEQSTLPQEVDLSAIDLDPREIAKISGGAGHTLILDKGGRVYSCGWNNKGQTGRRGAREELILDLRRIERLDDEFIEDIACGWNSSMAITRNGRVFVWGSNFYGQLGMKKCADEADLFAEPRETISLGEGITAISMGLRHSAVVTKGRKVLVAGSGSKFQLGIRDNEKEGVRSLSAFTEISELKDIVDVACGQNHTLALTKNSEIYAWGDNKHEQLGFDRTIKKMEYPGKICTEEFGDVMRLQVGWTHSCVLNREGRIFSWGRNTYGQLGYRYEDGSLKRIPKFVNCLSNIRQLSVGSEHNIALMEDGTVMSWGWNEHGNCGNGSTRDVLVPAKVTVPHGTKAILVGSGAGHSFAIFTEDS